MVLYAFANALYDDHCNAEELPSVFADLIAAGIPFTIEAVEDDDPDLDWIPQGRDQWCHAIRWAQDHDETGGFACP